MENTLIKFGFKKDGLYSWQNEPFSVVIYFDGVTISKHTEDGDSILYDGIIPRTRENKIELIEHHTKLKIINQKVINLLDSTKSSRIYSNTSLYVSNLLINYFKYNNVTEEDVCKKLNIDKEKLKMYLTGTYDFKISELAKISMLVGKAISVK